MTYMLRNPASGKTIPDLRCAEEPVHELFVNIITEKRKGDVVTLGNQRGKLESRNVEQK